MNKVYCVFYVSDETLERDLMAIFSTVESAKDYILRCESEDGYTDYWFEEWNVH